MAGTGQTTQSTVTDLEKITAGRRKKPWKYVGYRGFSQFIASDDDFLFLRRFGELNARVLLMLQDELVELETQLKSLDDSLSEDTAPDAHNGSFRQEHCQDRLDLLHEINGKLRAYNELVIQHSELKQRPRVPKKDVDSLDAWFHNHGNVAVHEDEAAYIHHTKDVFAVVPKSKTPLRRFLERSSHFRLFRLWRKQTDVSDENIHYTSDQRIDMFVSLIITIIGLVMLICPLWVLASVTPVQQRLAIITTFVVIFLCFVSFTTVARPFETLGAAAAYAAVLVVFLQITPS